MASISVEALANPLGVHEGGVSLAERPSSGVTSADAVCDELVPEEGDEAARVEGVEFDRYQEVMATEAAAPYEATYSPNSVVAIFGGCSNHRLQARVRAV